MIVTRAVVDESDEIFPASSGKTLEVTGLEYEI